MFVYHQSEKNENHPSTLHRPMIVKTYLLHFCLVFSFSLLHLSNSVSLARTHVPTRVFWVGWLKLLPFFITLGIINSGGRTPS